MNITFHTTARHPALQYLEVLQKLEAVDGWTPEEGAAGITAGRILYDTARQIRGAGLCETPTTVLFGEPPDGSAVGVMTDFALDADRVRAGALLARCLARPDVSGWWVFFTRKTNTSPTRKERDAADRFLASARLIDVALRGAILVTPKNIGVVRENNK